MRDIDEIFSECAFAEISGIKDKISAESFSALEAAKTVNKNTAFLACDLVILRIS